MQTGVRMDWTGYDQEKIRSFALAVCNQGGKAAHGPFGVGGRGAAMTRVGLNPTCLAPRALLEIHLGFEALSVAEDRGRGEGLSVSLVSKEAILLGDIALDRDLVPSLGMADVVDRDVVMLAPEEGSRRERRPVADHIERGDLALALRDNPMLDPNRLATDRIWPTRDIARGEYTGRARFEIGVDNDAPIHFEPCRLGKSDTRADA